MQLAELDSIIDEAADTLKHWFGIEEYGDPSVQSQVRLDSLSSSRR